MQDWWLDHSGSEAFFNSPRAEQDYVRTDMVLVDVFTINKPRVCPLSVLSIPLYSLHTIITTIFTADDHSHSISAWSLQMMSTPVYAPAWGNHL